jgi:hypothetical protein
MSDTKQQIDFHPTMFSCINGKWTGPTMPIQKSGTVIPSVIAEEAYKEYAAEYGVCQTLARINERGGFGSEELSILLFNRIKRIQSEINSGYWDKIREENTQLRQQLADAMLAKSREK